MSAIKEMFDDIVLLADTLDENGIDNFKFPQGISNEQIREWENANNVILPSLYREFLVLANGFRNHGSEAYSLEKIFKIEIPDEFKGYYAIGEYIGDGSLLLSDDKGNFYYGDHVNGVEQASFEEFLQEWIISDMKDSLADNGIEIPKLQL